MELHWQVKASREKVGRPCDMCSNYERQLQSVQDTEKKVQAQVRMLERQLQDEQQTNSNQARYIQELEEQNKDSAGQIQQQVGVQVQGSF